MTTFPKKKKASAAPRNQFLDLMIRFVASAFYLGKLPVIPGTFGSLLGVFIYRYILVKMHLHPLAFFFIYLGYFLTGVFVMTLAKDAFSQDEAAIKVFDKSLGAMIALSAFNLEVFATQFPKVVVAFCLFRLLDITKIFPIANLEKLPKGWGVMADDAGAGVIVLFFVAYLPESVWSTLMEVFLR